VPVPEPTTTLKIDHVEKVDVTVPVPEPTTLKIDYLAEKAVISSVPEPTTL